MTLNKGTPNTTYEFHLKCVRTLGRVSTDASGAGAGSFALGPNEARDNIAFDSYPAGGPSGNKSQSVTVVFRSASPITPTNNPPPAPTPGQPRTGMVLTAAGTCPPGAPYPSNNTPGACCSQPNLDYCGGGQCCDPGYCQQGRCCVCQTCNDRSTCCPGEYPDCQTCSLNSSNQQVCSTQANLCTESDEDNGQCGELIKTSQGRLPLSCNNTSEFCDVGGVASPLCAPLPACIWDDPQCALPGPLILPPYQQTDPAVSCLTNPDPNVCTTVVGTDCAGTAHSFSTTKKSGMCLQAITYARSPMSTETVRFADSCIPEGGSPGRASVLLLHHPCSPALWR